MNRSTPGLPVHHQLPEFTQTRVHRVSDAIQPSHPLSSPSPLVPNPSQHRSLFQLVNSRMRWPKYWSFSFSIIPSKEIPGLISFRMVTINGWVYFWALYSVPLVYDISQLLLMNVYTTGKMLGNNFCFLLGGSAP